MNGNCPAVDDNTGLTCQMSQGHEGYHCNNGWNWLPERFRSLEAEGMNERLVQRTEALERALNETTAMLAVLVDLQSADCHNARRVIDRNHDMLSRVYDMAGDPV